MAKMGKYKRDGCVGYIASKHCEDDITPVIFILFLKKSF